MTKNIDFWRSTADDDAELEEQRRRENREWKEWRKEENKIRKQFGDWNPQAEYRIKVRTNLNSYRFRGGYENKIADFARMLRRIRLGEDPANFDRSSGSQEPEDDQMYSPPDDARSPTPEIVPNEAIAPIRAASYVPQTYEEVMEYRARLSQGMGQASEAANTNPSSAPVQPPIVDKAAALKAKMAELKAQAEAAKSAEPVPPTPANPPVANPDVTSTSTSTPNLEQKAPMSAEEQRRKIAEQVKQASLKAKAIAAAAAAAKQSVPSPPSPPPPPPPAVSEDTDLSAPPPPPPAAVPYNPTISAPPVHYSHTISAPPVHYARPPKQAGDSLDDRPSKKQKTSAEPAKPPPTFAERMMQKMGYVKGQGLGKNNDGVTTHLEVKARKVSKQDRSYVTDDFDEDSPGGKAIKAAQVFDITGGLRKKKDVGPFGEPSAVVVLWGVADGVDFESDALRDDGGVRQEMGDVFDEKFGRIARIHINMQSPEKTVYVLFNDGLSALNAVNRFHEGYEFRGRRVKAKFYDETKFQNGVFDF
ncbi:hypothetical protein M011DRAFT_469309 [Sporormia fimetaria CBS 119925]|uniref:G-patch domain-containing protein n=1 Tax=Sporormia fimetaria CBS 119925 TaxID=1340428 RepID=A0A6A6V7Z1_9PLEO|nr:hypothetical protein M011DRAFT_469309 [Sporormia fimetaria CBS 119925]